MQYILNKRSIGCFLLSKLNINKQSEQFQNTTLMMKRDFKSMPLLHVYIYFTHCYHLFGYKLECIHVYAVVPLC
jgi:hypothetical protein